jgi:plasmid stability protein
MASLTIRNLDAAVKERLRVRAALRGHSMEAEARRIIQRALASDEAGQKGDSFYDRIHARFAAIGGVELDLPPREGMREPPNFDE